MIQIKNIQFTQLIMAGGRLREFNFRKSQGLIDTMFTVDVAGDKEERIYILFKHRKDEWTLENKQLINWVQEILPRLKEIIKEHV